MGEKKKYLGRTKIEDLRNNVYGKLTVIKYDWDRYEINRLRRDSGSIKQTGHYWICKCICGEIVSVARCHLKSGHTTSCGCYNREQAGIRSGKATYENSFGKYLEDNDLVSLWSDKNDKSPYEYRKSSVRKVWIKCDSDIRHKDYECMIGNFTKGSRCPVCANQKIQTGINDIATTRRDLIKYFDNIEDTYIYSQSSMKKVLLRCPECGELKEMVIDTLSRQGFGCKLCGDGFSKGQKIVNFLIRCSKYYSEYITERTEKWLIDDTQCKRRVDGYIPSLKFNIEVDGSFHRMDNRINGLLVKEVKCVDDWKDEQCGIHGEYVLRISYYDDKPLCDFKERIIKSGLLNVLDITITSIDWDKCFEFAYGSLQKESWAMWNSGDFETTNTLAKELGVDKSTIIRWLKNGKMLNKCNYDPKVESIKGSRKAGKSGGKRVEIFKDSVTLGLFDSVSQLERQSEELFGVKLNFGNISSVCRGEAIKYKGFMFRFVDEN